MLLMAVKPNITSILHFHGQSRWSCQWETTPCSLTARNKRQGHKVPVRSLTSAETKTMFSASSVTPEPFWELCTLTKGLPAILIFLALLTALKGSIFFKLPELTPLDLKTGLSIHKNTGFDLVREELMGGWNMGAAILGSYDLVLRDDDQAFNTTSETFNGPMI